MHIKDFTLTKHAVERALDMGVDPNLIKTCLLHPEKVTPSKSYPDCELYDLGPLTCSVAKDTKTVVTVLWRDREGWEQDLVGIGTYGGREYRG